MKIRVRVLYERDHAGRVQGSSYLRLLRPLTYPPVQEQLEVTFAPLYAGEPAELVIVDRFWQPALDRDRAHGLLSAVRRAGSRLIYALDDDLPSLAAPRTDGARILAEGADGILVTTPALAERMGAYNRHIVVVANALDDRLIPEQRPFRSRRRDEVVLGYMGTRTHDEDLLVLLPALAELPARCGVPLRLELIGGAARSETREALANLPFPVRFRRPPDPDYPHFMLWFVSSLCWDIGLAPLIENDFNRCKSDIKFLDYSALGVAAICSRVPAYSDSVEHERTGLLVADGTEAWSETLTALVRGAEERDRLAANARRYLFDQRVLSRRYPDLIGALERFLDD